MTDSVFRKNTVGFFATEQHLKPKRKTTGSAGYDFKAPETVVIPAHKFIRFDSGVKVRMRPGFVLKLYIRSSLGNRGIVLTNAVGIIDSDYKDTIQAMLLNLTDEDYTLYKGDHYMQGIFERYYLTDNDDAEGIRNGGLGSTGR